MIRGGGSKAFVVFPQNQTNIQAIFLFQTLRRIVNKCLEQLRKDKLTSIAIPAIGTGNLDFPRSEVSKIFFEEVTRFLTTHPPSIINDVRFVVYDPETADAFLGLLFLSLQSLKLELTKSMGQPGTIEIE